MDDLRAVVAAGHGVAEGRVLGRGLVHLHRITAHRGRAVVLVLGRAVGDAVDAGQLEALVGLGQLRVPPLVLAVDSARRDAVVEVHGLAHLAPGALDPGPIALLQAELGGCFRVDLHAGHRPQLATPRQLAMLAVEVHGDAATGGQDDGILFQVDLAAVGGRRGRLVVRHHLLDGIGYSS